MRVVIVGAGIAGLSAAHGLSILGWDVEIYEQAEKIEPVGAGLSLSANGLRALRTLGLYDAVVGRAQPIHRLDLLDQKGTVLQSTDFLEFSRHYGHLSMVVLHRGELHEALLSGLPKQIIRTGMECIGAREAGDRVMLEFADGRTVEAELVLACDGIHSAVRKALFPDAREQFARYACWRAISPGVPRMDPARLTESWGAGKRIGLASVGDDRVYWFGCCGADRINDPDLVRFDLAAVQETFDDFHEPIPEVLRRTPADSLIFTDILDLDPLPSFTRGTVVLLGDAAHAVTPDLGQGAGLALEDAAVLAALLGRYSVETALSEYDARRVDRARRITRESRLYARVAQWRNPVVVGMRNFLVKSIPERFMDRQLDAVLDVTFEPIRTAA
jgi:2-polyprenyl-6-methoxyphenol hydroxylase-like FAD-dependent oxidoreductase